jgi:hypothetical protein
MTAAYLLLLMLTGVHAMRTYRTRQACALAGRRQHEAHHWRCFKVARRDQYIPHPSTGDGQ